MTRGYAVLWIYHVHLGIKSPRLTTDDLVVRFYHDEYTGHGLDILPS
jgi:hypothetical protein